MGYALLGIAAIMGVAVFRLGLNADWHWVAALLAAAVPVAFTFFMGIIGLLVGGAFVAAVWKASEV